MRRALKEFWWVALLGVCAALAANFISPRGLSLSRDYFPSNGGAGSGAARTTVMSLDGGLRKEAGSITANAPAPASAPARAGIATISTAQALELFRDPQYEQELIVFVDARDSRHYEQGHIPGAFLLDRYYPQNHFAVVLPACLSATRVVVYCTGGECEDSHFAAQLLQDAGVPLEHLAVYAGGMKEWDAARLPVELGARKSGILKGGRP